jgi:hypothetical protein
MVMENSKQDIDRFFDSYANRFNDALNGKQPDVDEISGSFAEYFVESSPAGVMGGKNDESFRKKIPEGYAFYKKIGITEMKLGSKETTLLDDHHAMTRVHWNSFFTRKDKTSGNIEFDVIYFTRLNDDKLTIFCYITGDEQKALKANKLI